MPLISANLMLALAFNLCRTSLPVATAKVFEVLLKEASVFCFSPVTLVDTVRVFSITSKILGT